MYKILVVDDEPKIREVIKEYGEFSGYEITPAGQDDPFRHRPR